MSEAPSRGRPAGFLRPHARQNDPVWRQNLQKLARNLPESIVRLTVRRRFNTSLAGLVPLILFVGGAPATSWVGI